MIKLKAAYNSLRGLMTKEQIGKRLRELRQKKGLTQKAIAQMAGVDYTYIGKIERGEQFPSFKVILKISECLCLPLDRFFMDEATFRCINLIPHDIHTSGELKNLWSLLRLLENAASDDIPFLIEIIKVLQKHRKVRTASVIGKKKAIRLMRRGMP